MGSYGYEVMGFYGYEVIRFFGVTVMGFGGYGYWDGKVLRLCGLLVLRFFVDFMVVSLLFHDHYIIKEPHNPKTVTPKNRITA